MWVEVGVWKCCCWNRRPHVGKTLEENRGRVTAGETSEQTHTATEREMDGWMIDV